MGLGKMITVLRCHFSTSHLGPVLSPGLVTGDADPDHQAEVVFVSFSSAE